MKTPFSSYQLMIYGDVMANSSVIAYLLVGSAEISKPGGIKTMSSQFEVELSCKILDSYFPFNISYSAINYAGAKKQTSKKKQNFELG